MALRELRTDGDPVLNKVCRPVKEMNDRIQTLVEDMFDTMYEYEGVGLAAPQVGVLRRLFVIDLQDQVDENGDVINTPYVFINPEIIETKGEQTGSEGCLSIPNKIANVTRPAYVKVKAFDKNMEPFTLEAEGMFARCILHENDHLDGHLYKEIAKSPLMDLDDVVTDPETGEVHLIDK